MEISYFDKTWTLFLDRDGVINERIPNAYVKKWEEFKFMEGSKDAIVLLSKLFSRIIVVTNQQGIGKNLMTEKDLILVHQKMKSEIEMAGGRIDGIYFCPNLVSENSFCRKPNSGMGFQAQKDFPTIDFQKSIMVGDSISDMEFGIKLEMLPVFVETKNVILPKDLIPKIYARFADLKSFAESFKFEI